MNSKNNFDSIYNKFGKWVRAKSFHYLRNNYDVDELEQQVRCLYWKHKKNIDENKLPGWLKKVIWTTCVSYLRKKRRLINRFILDPHLDKGYTPKNTIDIKEELDLLFSQMEKMDVEMLRKVYLKGISLESLAKQSNLTVGCIKSRLHRVKLKAKEIGHD